MFTPLKDLPEGRNWTLDELNGKGVQLLIPVIIFISVVMVVGIVGNALVLYVNIFVFKLGNSTHRHFIIFLALTDIIFCMIGDPFEIGLLTYPYTFTNILACKTLSAFTNFTGLVSGLVLVAIALDRYRRICRPFGNQFSIRRMKIILGIIVFLSFIFSIPCFILHGKSAVQTGITNITGIHCFPDDMYKDTLFPIGYGVFLFSIFIIVTASISLFYTLIWHYIGKHEHSITETQQNIHDVDDPAKYRDEGNKGNKLKKPTDRAKTIRVSKMLFVVTTCFVLSFAPFLSLQVLIALDEQFVENLDSTSTMFFELFWRSFPINFMANPFVYGVMDRKFRMECKKLVLKRLRC